MGGTGERLESEKKEARVSLSLSCVWTHSCALPASFSPSVPLSLVISQAMAVLSRWLKLPLENPPSRSYLSQGNLHSSSSSCQAYLCTLVIPRPPNVSPRGDSGFLLLLYLGCFNPPFDFSALQHLSPQLTPTEPLASFFLSGLRGLHLPHQSSTLYHISPW